ncbi:C40 family peptidase [Hugenholtzia roseola]|uniref:C40 family peptidase n=1 Tax=Hugenholtzia roseola TaxID=1002 RepID=UPI000684C7FB|nr:C40 family peptidase [Hugenholtzia roseola]
MRHKRYRLFFIWIGLFFPFYPIMAQEAATAPDKNFQKLDQLYQKNKQQACLKKATKMAQKDRRDPTPLLFFALLEFENYKNKGNAPQRLSHLNKSIIHLRKAQSKDPKRRVLDHKKEVLTEMAKSIEKEADFFQDNKKEKTALFYYKHLESLFKIRTQNYQLLLDQQVRSQTLAEEVSKTPFSPQKKVDSLANLRYFMALEAEKYLGKPYQYASCNPEVGFDCSGFTSFIYQKLGVKLPRDSQSQINFGMEIEPEGLLEVGDLIFFQSTQSGRKKGRVSHVALVIRANVDEFAVIHATSRGIVIDSSESSVWQDYWQPRILGVKRILE